MLIATLAYDFLLSLLHPWLEPLRTWCIETFCPRTGQHLRLVKHPFVRLRKAMRTLWQAYPPQALLPREPLWPGESSSLKKKHPSRAKSPACKRERENAAGDALASYTQG